VTLSAAQLVALKNDIAADPVLNAQPRNSDGADAVAKAYNLPATPDFWVWRSSVSLDEYVNSVSVDGTTFSWTGTGYITRAQGERDAWVAMFQATGSANPSLANVRQAVADIFSGNTAPAPANRTHLLTISRRKASRAEKLFATGTGSTGTPATMGWEQPGGLTGLDVLQAWAS
jgi:hypothetical protein